jgi:NADH:ubiquinone oxidoreductase subunit K
MSTFVAKVFVLTIATAYAILLIALVIWIIRRKGSNGKVKGKGQK